MAMVNEGEKDLAPNALLTTKLPLLFPAIIRADDRCFFYRSADVDLIGLVKNVIVNQLFFH